MMQAMNESFLQQLAKKLHKVEKMDYLDVLPGTRISACNETRLWIQKTPYPPLLIFLVLHNKTV
jgi:hypothetical protein